MDFSYLHLPCIIICDFDKTMYICKNNKQLKVDSIKIRKSKTGYESVKTIYVCEDCSNCTYKSKCIKGNNSKTPLEERVKRLETSKKFNRQRKEDLDRISREINFLKKLNHPNIIKIYDVNIYF